MLRLTNKREGVSTEVKQGFYYYTANNSGPWMFRPDQTDPAKAHCVGRCDGPTKVSVVTSRKEGGATEVIQTFSDWITQTIRLLPGEDTVELEWTVGPIPVLDGISKEVFTRFSTSVNSGDSWKVDSNGYEMTNRRVNFRETYQLNVTEPIAGNVVNINGVISIEGEGNTFMVMNDRSQGGTSLRSGEIDVFLHRRLMGFDYPGGGMGPAPEPLNETREFDWGNDLSNGWTRHGPGIVVRGKHRIGIARNAARMYRRVQEQIFRTPVLGFYAAEPLQNVPFNTYNASMLRSDLPQNIHILSFQQTETKHQLTCFVLCTNTPSAKIAFCRNQQLYQ